MGKSIAEGVHDYKMKQLREKKAALEKRRSQRSEERSLKKEIRGLKTAPLREGVQRMQTGFNKASKTMAKSGFFGSGKGSGRPSSSAKGSGQGFFGSGLNAGDWNKRPSEEPRKRRRSSASRGRTIVIKV
jgi:hypothetical protein